MGHPRISYQNKAVQKLNPSEVYLYSNDVETELSSIILVHAFLKRCGSKVGNLKVLNVEQIPYGESRLLNRLGYK